MRQRQSSVTIDTQYPVKSIGAASLALVTRVAAAGFWASRETFITTEARADAAAISATLLGGFERPVAAFTGSFSSFYRLIRRTSRSSIVPCRSRIVL